MSEIKLPSPGQIAKVRQRTYLVEEVKSAKRIADSDLVRMSCLDDDNQGEPLEVLWQNEINPEILEGESWDQIAQKGLDEPHLFSAYLNTLKWNCVTATDPELFQSPFRAGIRLDAYQLEPLRKALLLPRVNLFIADDVGLGKTIEAGLIARELLMRKRANEIVVAAPPSMLFQWKDELETRFGLTFEIYDKNFVQTVRRERGFSVNPWTTHSRFLISHRLLIDEAYTAPLRDWLGTFRSGAMLILDEAHHAAPASGAKYAIDSKLTRAIEDLAKRFEHRLFLSATPHNGHSNSFSRLLELLDPQRFCRGVPVSPEHRDEVIVRRLKEDIREVQGGFPRRNVVQVDIDGLPENAPELALANLLSEYAGQREERLAAETKKKQAASKLLICGLQQRLLSSIEAFARTLKVHERTVTKQWEKRNSDNPTDQPKVIRANKDLVFGGVGADDDRAEMSEEQLANEVDLQFEAISTESESDQIPEEFWEKEQAIRQQMTEIAESARFKPDSRIEYLVNWIRENMCPDLGKPNAEWNETRVLIFTEYDDTKRYIVRELESVIEGSHQADRRMEIFHGPTPADKREEIKRAFNAPPNENPIRILVATDAAREGLNLQAHCWNLFHFDVPWNPSRMEQRNGRIDRKLQPKDEVNCHYFVYKQRPEDRILEVLVKKTATIREELGSLSQVIDSKLAKTLKDGIRRSALDSIQSKIEKADIDADQKSTIEKELEAARERQDDLRKKNEVLRELLDKSKNEIGLDDQLFQSAVSSSLQILGAEPLAPFTDEKSRKCWSFPALDEIKADWVDTMDSLRALQQRGQKKWDWRRESPIRPIVFKDTGTVDDSVVHLHLEHRIVRRLLGRFISQGFVHDDLSRACLTQTSDAIPRAILFGRLALYGPGAARLHEELIPISARWTDVNIRTESLTPFEGQEHQKSLTLLQEGFQTANGPPVNQKVADQLRESAARDISELLPHLYSIAEAKSAEAVEKLRIRAEEEAKAMKQILETQRQHIRKEIKDREKDNDDQLRLDFANVEDELRQYNANKRYWAERLEQLREELRSEPERIQQVYEVQATRVEPVGLVYLWPVTG